jgi:NADH-quinone oxidoreductase subunit J
MLLGAEHVESSPSLVWQRPVAILLGLVLIAQFVFVLFGFDPSAQTSLAPIGKDFGSPTAIGSLLFREYLVPFEVTSILLLAAMVGAIVLTRDARKGER